MTNRNLIIAAIIALIALGAFFYLANRSSTESIEEPAATETTTPAAPVAETPAAQTITYTDDGFSPGTLTVAAGDTVTFVNNSSGRMWVGADEHPTHTEYDGSSTREHCSNGNATSPAVFDQCEGTSAGTSWSFTFTKAGSFNYHNHARAADGGTIIVR